MEDAILRAKLDRLLVLLRDHHESEWHAHFQKASALFAEGKLERAKKKIRSAYGGMCSFNDALYFTGAPKEIADEGYRVRDELYVLSQPSGFSGFILRLVG